MAELRWPSAKEMLVRQAFVAASARGEG